MKKQKCTCHVCKMIARIKAKEKSWDDETRKIVDDLFGAWASESDDATFYKSDLEMLKKKFNVDIKQIQEMRHEEFVKH